MAINAADAPMTLVLFSKLRNGIISIIANATPERRIRRMPNFICLFFFNEPMEFTFSTFFSSCFSFYQTQLHQSVLSNHAFYQLTYQGLFDNPFWKSRAF